MAYRTPSSVRTHVSVPTSDDLRVKDVRELRVDAQRLLDSRERDEPEGLASPLRHDEEARSPVEAFFDDEAPAPDYDGTVAPAAAPGPAPAEDPSLLRCAWRELGSTRGLHFWPRDSTPKAVALLLPSSDGGLGPGVARYPQALEKCHTQRGRGALFLRLAHELATGRAHTWSYEDTGSQLKWQTNHHGKFKEEFVNGDVSSLILDWSAVRKKKMKLARQGSLETAVDDAFIACAWLMEQYPRAYVLIVGHGFGGAVGWACLDRLQRKGLGHRIGGMATIAGHAFGGDAYDLRNLSTPPCIDRSSCPCLFLHGSRDGNVALQISEFLHAKALARKKSRGSSLTIVSGADHGFASRRDVAFTALRDWALGTLPKGQIPIAKRKKKKRKPKIIVVDDDDNSVEDVLDATPFSRLVGKRDPHRSKNRIKLRKVKPLEKPTHPLCGMCGFWELDK